MSNSLFMKRVGSTRGIFISVPDIISPLQGATGQSLKLPIVIKKPTISEQTCVGVEIETSIDGRFTTLDWQSGLVSYNGWQDYSTTATLTHPDSSYWIRARFTADVTGKTDYCIPVEIKTRAVYIAAPTITSPSSGATLSTSKPTIDFTGFQWVGMEDNARNTQVQVLYSDTTTIIEDSGPISPTTRYTCRVNIPSSIDIAIRVRHSGAQWGWSAWSPFVMVRSANAYIAAPTITAPPAGQSCYASVNVVTSPFTVINGTDTHVASDWKITSDIAGNNILMQDLNSSDKLSHVFNFGNSFPPFVDGGTYYLWARHKGATYGNSPMNNTGRNFITTNGFSTLDYANFIGGDQITAETLDFGNAQASNVISNTPFYFSLSLDGRVFINRQATGTTSLTEALSKTYTANGYRFWFQNPVGISKLFVGTPTTIGISSIEFQKI